jgi:hypothetical protein
VVYPLQAVLTPNAPARFLAGAIIIAASKNYYL